MGNNPSSQVGEARGNDSRASSPLPGEEADSDYDGLPRLQSSPSRDYHVASSQPVDGLPTFSPAAQQTQKQKKSRKAHTRRSSDTNHNGGGSHAEQEHHDAPATDDLEALARNLKSEPESPEAVKSKKKRRKKTKGHAPEQYEDQPVLELEPREVSEDVPAVAEDPEVAVVSEVAEMPDEVSAPPATALPEETLASSFESPSLPKRKKKKKNKSKPDNAKEARLDLNEDPIAGSDDDVVISSAEVQARRTKSRPDENGSSRKFRKKRTPVPTVSADVIESTQDDAASESLGATRNGNHFLRRSKEPEQYEIGEDKISPSVTRQERRTRHAPSRSASASPAEVPSPKEPFASPSHADSEHQIRNEEPNPPSWVPDGDRMDLDNVQQRLGGSVDRASSKDGRGPPSEHGADLPDHQDQDQAMEDGPVVPKLSQPHHARQEAPERTDLMSTMDDDVIMAIASSQGQRATGDDGQQKGALPKENGALATAPSEPGTSSDISDPTGQRGSAQAGAESRMALQSMLDKSRNTAEATAWDVTQNSDAELPSEIGRGPGLTRPSSSSLFPDDSWPGYSKNLEAEATMSQNATTPPNGTAAVSIGQTPSTAHRPSVQTPRVQRSSAHSTPRTSRTYSRQPKPSFFDRGTEETAQAFAELPSQEVAATPKPTKPKAKRRLPIDVPDAETGPSKRHRSSLLGPKAAEASKDPNAPKNTPARRKAPETAIRGSTGFLTGALTKTEVSQVEGAVEAFREDHGLEKHEVNAMIQQNPKDRLIKDNSLHEELWSRIREACPTRPRQKLLNWCRQKFHNFVARATWTPEQDEELRQMVQQHGTKWSVIGQLINRHQKDVRDRWRNYLVAGDNQRKHIWTPEEEQQFLEIVAEVLSIFQREREQNPDSDMFRTGKTNEELVDWNVVAERMHFARSRLQCQEKWRRMRESNKINATVLAGLLEPDERWRLKRARHEIATMSHADMYHIVLGIPTMDGAAKEDIRINWRPILDSQRKKYHRYTAMLLWSRLRQLVPDQESKDVQECAKELIRMYQSDGGTFAIPGDEAFDEAKEEEILAQIPPPRRRGSGKQKSDKGKGKGKGKGKRQEGRDSTEGRVISEEFAYDSDSDDGGDRADDGDSSRATHDETSPAPEPGQQSRHRARKDDDEVSLDLANDAGRDDRGASVDLAIHPAIDGEQQDRVDPKHEQPEASPKSRKKSKSKSKFQETETPSAVKRHKKRYSSEMTLDFGQQGTPGGSSSKKRARADDVGTPDGSGVSFRKKKRAKRALQASQVEQQAAAPEGIVSSDDDMGDIPARLPRIA